MGTSSGLKTWCLAQCGVKNWESARDVYLKRRIIAVIELQIVEWHNYKHLDWITVRRDDDKLYKFKKGDFKRLRIQDIEGMLLLLVQGKVTNLTVEERFAFNVSLRMFTKSIVIQWRVEDLHLGFIYQNKDKQNRLMRIDELHKFSDGTLNDVRTALDGRLKGIRMKSILTDSQVTPTKPGRMTKPYSSHRFIANYFNEGHLKMEVKDKNGAITRYKARFVAKGFWKQPDIDFHETYSPVVKSTTIRAVLSLAEHVYMKQPSGFIDPQRPNHVCLLHKSLYGLKHASRTWFECLSKDLFDLGFKGSKTDLSLFIYSPGDTLLYIMVYVDDIIFIGNNKGTINNIVCQLGSAFVLKDLRPLNYFLGIKIVLHVSYIILSQKKYIVELTQIAGLSNCNLVSSPMVTTSSLSLDDSTTFSNPVKYRQVVGSLQYVTLSRPDIAFAVNKECQYMHALTKNHWSAVKRILRYLHGTVKHGILIRCSSGSTLQDFIDLLLKGNPDTSLEAFLYAEWAGDSDDRRSTGRFAIYLEAEYKALADTVAELTWLQTLLNKLGIRSSSTPILWWDNP
nr:hypothetical protein [Tanacetum cinerariifolium]